MTDTTRFEGYGVLVTGAARGIGAAVSRRLAEEGARVLTPILVRLDFIPQLCCNRGQSWRLHAFYA